MEEHAAAVPEGQGESPRGFPPRRRQVQKQKQAKTTKTKKTEIKRRRKSSFFLFCLVVDVDVAAAVDDVAVVAVFLQHNNEERKTAYCL